MRFHKLSNKDKRNELMVYTIAEILSIYEQPKWCNKHEALNGLFGCEILLGLTNETINRELCSNCENYKK